MAAVEGSSGEDAAVETEAGAEAEQQSDAKQRETLLLQWLRHKPVAAAPTPPARPRSLRVSAARSAGPGDAKEPTPHFPPSCHWLTAREQTRQERPISTH